MGGVIAKLIETFKICKENYDERRKKFEQARYVISANGTCHANGMRAISSLRACEVAAQALGLPMTSASGPFDYPPRPNGCVTTRDRAQLFFYSNYKANYENGPGNYSAVA